MTDYDPDELLAMVIEAVAENLAGDDAEVIELPVEDRPHSSPALVIAVLLDQPGVAGLAGEGRWHDHGRRCGHLERAGVGDGELKHPRGSASCGTVHCPEGKGSSKRGNGSCESVKSQVHRGRATHPTSRAPERPAISSRMIVL